MRPIPLWSDPALLDRYLAGETTASELEAVERWLVANPEERRTIEAIRAGAVDPYGPVPAYDADARTSAILDYSVRAARRMRRQSVMDLPSAFRHVERGRGTRSSGRGMLQWGGFKGRPLRRGVWYTMAGAVFAVVMLVVSWRVDVPSSGGGVAMHVPMAAYVTGNAERATITLPDGNTVTLNVASRLEVPADYVMGNHILRLSGEALFTIQHRSGTSVTILTGQTTTRVLGTSFVVRHYPADSMTRVAVREGKVSVGNAVVAAGRLAEVRRDGLVEMRPATSGLFAFASGILTLDNLTVSQAIPLLNRWYDADIRLGDSVLAERLMSGTCAPGSLTALSTILEMAVDVRVVRHGRILTLYPRR